MDKWFGKVAIVTGASAGIGASIAVCLANAGMRVVGAARSLNAIEKLKSQIEGNGSIHPYKCDILNPLDIDKLFAYVDSEFGGPSVLVNNAAVLYEGTLFEVTDNVHTLSMEEVVQSVNVNIVGVVHCTKLAIKSMKERNVPGHIINLNSICGHRIPCLSEIPTLNIYTVTKHGITALSEITRLELSGSKTNIKFTSITPGAVDTDMIKKVKLPDTAPRLCPRDIADAVMYTLSTRDGCNISEITIQAKWEGF